MFGILKKLFGFGKRNDPQKEGLQLISFDKLPVGENFRLDAGGNPGLSVVRKTDHQVGHNRYAIFKIGDEKVWWIKEAR